MTISGRREKRVVAVVTAQLLSLDNPSEGETAFTENLSSQGARVVTHRAWQRNERVVVVSAVHRMRARVVYCKVRNDGGYSVGLEFLRQAADGVDDLTNAWSMLHGDKANVSTHP